METYLFLADLSIFIYVVTFIYINILIKAVCLYSLSLEEISLL